MAVGFGIERACHGGDTVAHLIVVAGASEDFD